MTRLTGTDANPTEEKVGAAFEEAQAELRGVLGELRVAASEAFDWRTWVRRHPGIAVGLALFVGYRLARRG